MNEQDNLRIVKEGYADFARGDVQTLLGKFAEDIEWIIPGSKNNPLSGTYKGRNRVAEFFRLLSDSTELSTFEPREFVAQGDNVVVLGRESGRVKSTGRMFQVDWAMAFTVRNGTVVRFQEYTDTSTLEAAFNNAQSASA
jgi:ketosteroid isomerase-like protein